MQAAVGGDVLRKRRDSETGWKHDALVALDRWLRDLPSTAASSSHALEATRLGFEILIGIFFVFASAAYWIFEREPRDRARHLAAPERQAAASCATPGT